MKVFNEETHKRYLWVRVFLLTAGLVALLWARFCRAAAFVSPATAKSHNCLAAVGQLWASQLCPAVSLIISSFLSVHQHGNRDAVEGFKLAWSPVEGNRCLIGGCVVTYCSPFIMGRRHMRLGPDWKAVRSHKFWETLQILRWSYCVGHNVL